MADVLPPSTAPSAELVLQGELSVRYERMVARRTRAAYFRDQKTLEDFDWDFNRSVKRKQVFDLAAGKFVRKHRDVLLLGPPRVGKSHIAQSIGHQLIQGGFLVLYCSIVDSLMPSVTCCMTKLSKATTLSYFPKRLPVFEMNYGE